jgi:C-terminal processing protease CtpA/Prc
VSSGVGGLQSWREQQVIPDLIAQLYLHGIRAPYTVTYKRGTEVYTTPVKALKLHELQAQIAALRKNAPPAPKPLPFSFVRMDKNIGYINFTNMRSPVDTFRKFLNETFSDIKQNGLRGLVIDLRQNGGGNSMLGYALLHYITDKSFRMAGGGLWKVSREYKSYMQTKGLDTGKLNTVTKQYLAMDNGKVKDIKPSKPQKTGKNNLRYKGNVVVLIGPKTFSSANMTANTIQDYKLATLIGEATGEPANDYGELYDSRLPHTGFQFVTSSKMFIRANGNKEDKNPVLPDITVEQNPDSDRDNVLDFAIQWLKRQKKSGK